MEKGVIMKLQKLVAQDKTGKWYLDDYSRPYDVLGSVQKLHPVVRSTHIITCGEPTGGGPFPMARVTVDLDALLVSIVEYHNAMPELLQELARLEE